VTALKHYIVSAILAIVMMQVATIWATPNHPFWTGAQYTIADSLHAGDRLYGADGGNIFIQEIIRKDTSAEVYNFAVEDNENYFVGRSSVLVHNSNCFLKNIENLDILSANLNNLSPLLKKQFLQDFENAGSELLEVLNKPNGVKAWEGLVNRPEWVRKNIGLLERIAGKGDDYISRVNNLYSPSVMKLPPNLKPPNSPPGIYNGIEFDNFGFPKFEPFVSNNNHVVKIVMDGTNDDYIKAYNELKKIVGEGNIQFTNNFGSSFKLKQNGEWSEQVYTWHHHQDGETMMPVLQEIHQSVQNYHTGGRSIINNNLKGLFNPPQI